jgi:hypothetical protein
MNWARIGTWLLALALLAAFVFGFWTLSARAFASLDGQTAVALATFVGTTWFAIWSFQKTKRKEAEAQLFSEKAKVYGRILDLLRDVFFAQKGWIPPLDQEELAKRFGQVRFDMVIWGGQDTIRAIGAIEDAHGDSGKTFAAFINLYAQIRKELGHGDDRALAEELFLAQVIAEDREKTRNLIRSGGNPD